jgi:hypothetical protein
MENTDFLRQIGVYFVYGWLACFPLFILTTFLGRFFNSDPLVELGKYLLKLAGIVAVIFILIFIVFFNGLEEMQKMGGYIVDRSQVGRPIYENRSTDSQILGYTQRFDGITIQEQVGEWTYIDTTSGISGWIRNSDLQGTSSESRIKHAWDLSLNILKDMFSLQMAKDILIGSVISLVVIFIFGKARGEFIDERLGLLIAGVTIGIVVFADYDFRTAQEFVEWAGVVGAKVFLSGFAGLVSASFLEMIFVNENREIGCGGLIFGTIAFFLFILYYSYIAFG